MKLHCICLSLYISQDFRRFLLALRINAPMIHMLFNMCQRLIQDILDKLIIHENIMKTTKSKQTLLPAAKLCELDLKDVVVQRVQCEFGAHVKSLLNKFDAFSQRKIGEVLIKFYIACSNYLIENLPINGQAVANYIPYLKNLLIMLLLVKRKHVKFLIKKVKVVLMISLTNQVSVY